MPRRTSPGSPSVLLDGGRKAFGDFEAVWGLDLEIQQSSVYLGTSTQLAVRLADDVRMTVLCRNSDDAERQSHPGADVAVRLSWVREHMHLVRERADGTPTSAMEKWDNQTAEEATTT